MTRPSPHTGEIRPRLGLWDAVSIIVGIVVGTAIFKSPTVIFQNTAGPWPALGVWLLGGVLALIGGLCYAELATTYPRSGGDYEYLRRAYGSGAGFLFGWAQLTVVLTGSIGAMAYAFADYGKRLWDLTPDATVWLALAAIVVPTLANALGVVVGKTAQNILSAAKVIGLAGVVAAGLLWGGGGPLTTPAGPIRGQGFALAMVFVLYAYGGWNDAAFVAAEVRNRAVNLPRALILGTIGITAIYLAVNAAYLLVLGFDGARETGTPASDVLQRAMGTWGSRAVSLLVMISALGAINGMILTGSRVYASLGADHRIFARLGRWNTRRGAPVTAILTQGGVAVVLVFAVGTAYGRGAIDDVLAAVGLPVIPWQEYFGGFETLVAGSAPVFWSFFLATGIAVFVLRAKDPHRERPFRIPWFPVPPIIFCCMCGYMLYASLGYARMLALLGTVPLLLGVPLYAISRR
ncbi:MAG: APC family permease [Planctomycetota bacterium]|jgi:amino acid transporter